MILGGNLSPFIERIHRSDLQATKVVMDSWDDGVLKRSGIEMVVLKELVTEVSQILIK